jgi:hypothetical protein
MTLVLNEETTETNVTHSTEPSTVLNKLLGTLEFLNPLVAIADLQVAMGVPTKLTGTISNRPGHSHDVYEIRGTGDSSLVRITVEAWKDENDATEVLFD